MIEVTKRHDNELSSSLLRRFNRRIQQSGVLILAKRNRYFHKPISKRERRLQAIRRNRRHGRFTTHR